MGRQPGSISEFTPGQHELFGAMLYASGLDKEPLFQESASIIRLVEREALRVNMYAARFRGVHDDAAREVAAVFSPELNRESELTERSFAIYNLSWAITGSIRDGEVLPSKRTFREVGNGAVAAIEKAVKFTELSNILPDSELIMRAITMASVLVACTLDTNPELGAAELLAHMKIGSAEIHRLDDRVAHELHAAALHREGERTHA